MSTFGKQAVVSGAGVALTFSLLAHAGVALFAVRQTRLSATVHALVPAHTELASADQMDVVDVVEAPQSLPNAVATTRVVNAAPLAPALRAPAQPAAVSSNPSGASSAPSEAETAVLAAPTSEPSAAPHFALMVAPTIGGAVGANVSGSAVGSTSGTGSSGPIPAAAAEVPARLRSGAPPAYTAAALSAGVEANVLLEIVVADNGAVSSARPLQHVGYGLDEVALSSVLAYRFTPALRAGKPVAVRMQWLMRFQLS
jgi:periplasmic protein TonB